MKKDYAEKIVKNGKIIDSEIKYPVHEFEIDKGYDLEERNKIEAFRRETGTTKTLGVVVHEDDRTRNGIKNRRGRT